MEPCVLLSGFTAPRVVQMSTMRTNALPTSGPSDSFAALVSVIAPRHL